MESPYQTIGSAENGGVDLCCFTNAILNPVSWKASPLPQWIRSVVEGRGHLDRSRHISLNKRRRSGVVGAMPATPAGRRALKQLQNNPSRLGRPADRCG